MGVGSEVSYFSKFLFIKGFINLEIGISLGIECLKLWIYVENFIFKL